MAKKIFRYLCGELNGQLVTSLHHFLNDYISSVFTTFAYAKNMVFKLESEDDITGEEIPIRDEDVFGIGKIAGVFVPYISQESNQGCIVFTSSFKVNGNEYSERGLFSRGAEVFIFNRTDESEYTDDITTLATPTKQASFVPHGAPILGYIAMGDVVLNQDGSIITSAVRATPPVDGTPYFPYYGTQYLILSESFVQESYLDVETYKKLFEEMQIIRYTGVSILSLLNLKKILLEDYVCNLVLTPAPFHVVLHYSLNPDSILANKRKRLYIWRAIMAAKFKQVVLQEDF